MRHATLAGLFLIVIGGFASGQDAARRVSDGSNARIDAPREAEWSGEQRQLAAEFSPAGAPANDLRTLLVHPALVRGVMPFANYINSASSLPARDRALLTLRTAWLSGAGYLWAKHVPDAERAGFSAAEIGRIAVMPVGGWPPFETALLHAADQLHRTAFIDDGTWKVLAARYDTGQLMDAVFTIAETTMLSGVANSVRIPIDAQLRARMPARTGDAGPRTHVPLTAPRIPPLEPSEWTPQVRAMLDPNGSGRGVAAVYRTFAQHPALYPPRQTMSEYIRLRNTLPPRVREMLILRIGFLCGSEYEWAAHARAGRAAGLTSEEIERLARDPQGPAPYDGWSAGEAALVRSVDELHATDTISDATWAALAASLDQRQLLDLLITTGGYRMVSMALNTLGVPLEPNSERFPATARRP